MMATGTMATRERFHAVINGRPFDRLPIVEWASWWDKTIDRWHGEGLPAELKDRYDLCRHFGQDIWKQDYRLYMRLFHEYAERAGRQSRLLRT